ncbi:MAG: FAD-dependent oxidoreductase [Patescibacteria group bacterium]
MKVAILGGGFAGLSAAYYLQKKGHEVTIFERDKELGGLAVGFTQPHWDWTLERAYHHLFATDSSILELAKVTDFNGIFYQAPETAALYKIGNNYRTFPVDTPQDFLKFPLLSFIDKLRSGFTVLFLKLTPFLKIYESKTCEQFFSNTMGKQGWELLFGTLLRKKYGKYAGKVLASFIWARVKVRTKSLGYVKGGFQAFVKHLEKTNTDLGVDIQKEHEVQEIGKERDAFKVTYLNQKGEPQTADFDTVISTLPSPILAKIAADLFPSSYFEKYKKLTYLNAVVLVLETKNPILDKAYWLNICIPDMPLMLVCQHTNFIDKKYYGGNNIAYIGWYVDKEDALWSMDDKEIVSFIKPHLKKINADFDLSSAKTHLFKAPFAQPVFDKNFVENKPDFITPVKNFFIANLDMTYPNDRGTNYAVALGKKVSELI